IFIPWYGVAKITQARIIAGASSEEGGLRFPEDKPKAGRMALGRLCPLRERRAFNLAAAGCDRGCCVQDTGDPRGRRSPRGGEALQGPHRSSATSRASFSGVVVGANRDRTAPNLSTRNFVKFHFMLLPSSPPFCRLSQT